MKFECSMCDLITTDIKKFTDHVKRDHYEVYWEWMSDMAYSITQDKETAMGIAILNGYMG